MENEMDDLKSIWKTAKSHASQTSKTGMSAEALIRQAESKKKQAMTAHYGNIIVLALVVVMLVVCFIYFFPFRHTLSRTGVALMVGGLIVRIGIEFFSVVKSNKVKVSDTTAQATDDTVAFYQFRKKIHGPVTLTIVLLYIIGFYMLTPEFSIYVPLKWMIIFDVGFLVGGVVLAWYIRKGNKKELEDLKAVVEIREQLRNAS